MKPFDIYSGTADFRRMKLFLGLGMTLLVTLLYVVMVGLPSLASKILSYVLLPVWAGFSVFLCVKIYRSFGYRIDAGHLGIITGAITEGFIPRDMVTLSSDMVSQRFRPSKSYFTAKKWITGAVNEISVIFSRETSLVGDVPGMKLMVEIGRLFLRFHLTYMTRCCMAYTFFRGDEGLYLSASEGCAIFAINWKRLTKSSADISIGITAGIALLTAALGIALYALMGVIGLGAFSYFGVILAFMLVLTIKNAYLDVWFTCYYVHMYMHLAEYSEPNPNVYLQLERMSPSFKHVASLANGKFPTPKKTHTFAALRKKHQQRTNPKRPPDAVHTLICPRCKSANLPQAKFCAGCGTQLKLK